MTDTGDLYGGATTGAVALAGSPPALALPRPLSATLADHVSHTRYEDLPAAVIEAAKWGLLDQLGVILAASGLDEASLPFVEIARVSGGSGASVIGHRFETSPVMAAVANGAMAHALDFEDTHDATLVHPHASVVPAALAIAQARGSTGRDLVRAIAIGADLSCRLATGFDGNPEHPNGFMLLTSIGAFGAAAAVSSLLELAPEQVIQAFASTMGQVVTSAATKAYGPSHVRAVRDGYNAKAAVLAGLLAEQGHQAFDRPFEGPAGYYALFAKGAYDPDRILDALGEQYLGTEVSFKPWPCCRGAHAFVEAALALRPVLANRDFSEIEVVTSPFFASLCEPEELRKRPPTSIAAKFSIPYAVGIALRYGSVALEHFGTDALSSVETLDIAARVHHRVDLGRVHADATGGTLTITLADGQKLSKTIDFPRGHCSNPMTADELVAKFRACASYAAVPFAPETLELLPRRLQKIEQVSSVRRLLDP